MKVKLHIRVVPYVGAAFDMYRVVEMPHVEVGMRVYGVRFFEGDTSIDEIEQLSWDAREPKLVEAYLGIEGHRKDGILGDEEWYSDEVLIKNRFQDWTVAKDTRP